MEKRVLLAAVISIAFMLLYSKLIVRWYGPPVNGGTVAGKSQGPPAVPDDQAERTQLGPVPLPDQLYFILEEDVVSIESDELRVEIGRDSGAVRQVVLKRFQDSSGQAQLGFGGKIPVLMAKVGHKPFTWHLLREHRGGLVLEANGEGGNRYHLTYTLAEDVPVIQLRLDLVDRVEVEEHDVVIAASWHRGDDLNSRQNALEATLLSEDNGRLKTKRLMSPFQRQIVVPRGTILVSLSERYFCQSIRPETDQANVTALPSPDGTIVAELVAQFSSDVTSSASTHHFEASSYIGPRDYFYLKRAGFERAFHIGMIGQIGLILLFILKGISSVTGNYGLAIIVLSFLVTCVTAPFTLIGFRSMRKMQELKPQIDKVMAQHKHDPSRAQREMLAIYKEHRVSPMSGCLPMLLQMPVFIALFNALSHFIELRGESFLWIQDLSMPDRIARLPFALPIIGHHINLLPIVMSVAMYMQTKLSQGTATGQTDANPMAKMMSGPLMSIIFGVAFYNFQSGLVLYWLTNSLISMVWYKLAK
jgi:YidC/Oxa1 family membrane protein insertase